MMRGPVEPWPGAGLDCRIHRLRAGKALLTFSNVLITGHQGFFTREALSAIAATTVANLTAFERDGAPLHPVTVERVALPVSAKQSELMVEAAEA